MNLETKNASLGYGRNVVVSGMSITLKEKSITTLIGTNGSGKSTLLKALARLLTPFSGEVLLDGKDIASQPTRHVAQQLAILPQTPSAPEGLSVEELVWFGRHPYQGIFASHTEDDHKAVEDALIMTDMLCFRDRPLENLSGGQRQRAWIAMALAQDTPILLLDEPTTYLDLNHQVEVLTLLQELNQKAGKTIIMVLHDLNQASKYSHELVVLKSGELYAQGTPKEIMNDSMLREVFCLEAHILQDPDAGTPYIIPYGVLGSRSTSGNEDK